MPIFIPMPTLVVGDILTTTRWGYLRDNINKLLSTGHRTLTVAQFTALAAPEGTKGTISGDEVYLEVDATNGILWHLVYESTETTYKWRFLGGPPLVSEVLTSETTASATYAALTTAGPSIALPRAGDYDVVIECFQQAASTFQSFMSYDIGGTGAVDADSLKATASASNVSTSNRRTRRKAGLATSTLTAKYRTTGSVPGFADRSMSITPARIRHDA